MRQDLGGPWLRRVLVLGLVPGGVPDLALTMEGLAGEPGSNLGSLLGESRSSPDPTVGSTPSLEGAWLQGRGWQGPQPLRITAHLLGTTAAAFGGRDISQGRCVSCVSD